MITIREILETWDKFLNQREAAQLMHRCVNPMAHIAVLSAVLDELVKRRYSEIWIACLCREMIRMLAGFNELDIDRCRIQSSHDYGIRSDDVVGE